MNRHTTVLACYIEKFIPNCICYKELLEVWHPILMYRFSVDMMDEG